MALNGRLPVMPAAAADAFAALPDAVDCGETRSVAETAHDRQVLVDKGRCPAGDPRCFGEWATYARAVPNLIVSDVVQFGARAALPAAARWGYDAPFPSRTFKAAVRAFPSMIAGIREPAAGNARAWARLGAFARPFLALSGGHDGHLAWRGVLGSPAVAAEMVAHVPARHKS